MLSKKDLPEKVQEELKAILDKDPVELDDYQRAVLNARVDYLSVREKEQFGDVMKEPINRKKIMAGMSAEPVRKFTIKKPFIKR